MLLLLLLFLLSFFLSCCSCCGFVLLPLPRLFFQALFLHHSSDLCDIPVLLPRRLLQSLLLLLLSRSGDLRMQKLKSHLVRTQSLNVLPFKPGVGQYIAIRATLTARDFFLAYFYPPGPFTCIFPKPLLISPLLAVANTWFLVGPQNKIGQPAGCRFPC